MYQENEILTIKINKMTIKEIKEEWYKSNCNNSEVELLRDTVLFLNMRPEKFNQGKSYQSLINDYLRFWHENQN